MSPDDGRAPVDYDRVAATYDRRYAINDYGGIRDAVLAFAPAGLDVLEVGCGTGHWLGELAPRARTVAGVDRSGSMLARARAAVPGALLARGSAEALPVRAGAVDRVLVVHAMHHFDDKAAFVREARRVLRPGGGVMIAGLDPHTGLDRWWVYEHFPAAVAADRARYPSAAAIRGLLEEVGFAACETRVVLHRPVSMPVREALERGVVARESTSQLMVIGDDEYAAGLERLRALAASAPAGGAEPMLHADLRIYGTTGWLPA